MESKATVFEFTSYAFEPEKKRIVFNYTTTFTDLPAQAGKDPIFFTETILLPEPVNLSLIPKGLVDKLLQSLHLVLGISYYKFYCATEIKIPYTLSKEEAGFWNTVYKKGLGEFFYKNNLDPNISPQFPFVKTGAPVSYSLPKNNRCLVGIGGGKDSIVSAELLKKENFDITAFNIETNKKSGLIDNIINMTGAKSLTIQRFLDWQTNQEHDYNGHVPISAIYAFLGLFASTVYGYSYVVVSNEYSSNFGNITYKGLVINHQWSKSFEFEHRLSDYVREYISPDVAYFSLLRSFYEIRIVKMFAGYRKYFPYFSSCNRNFSTTKKIDGGLWCCECAKCVFVFTLLSAFLSKKDVIGIFGKNLYREETLLPLFKDILGLGAAKPFDCVGTFEEAQTAMHMAKKNFAEDFIIKELSKKITYHKEVFKTQKESLVPEQFKFLGMENALVLGYGKEGKVTRQYLKKHHPQMSIGIADATGGKDYLEKQKDFDVAVKTPGISKNLVTIPYTTATNIFFSKVLGKNTIIGITGSKGKSTTSSLIYSMLKEGGKHVELLGNIGKPMLQALLEPVTKDTIFVLELSSYQLDDLQCSPDIAVVTNLFPEHMDFHGGLKNYYEAKKNIIRFQNKNNHFIYNPKNKEVITWLGGHKGNATPFTKSIPLEKSDIPLLGEHNRDNIRAAITVAKILNIPDEAIRKAVKNFKALAHRLEFVGEYNGIRFYNDAISTTPESTIMAIQSIPDIGTLFLGGQDRGYNFAQLEKTIKKYRIKNIVLFPDSGKKILRSKKDFNILETSSMEKAVAFAYKYTKEGQACVLSCASPSYSVWKNFEEKGDQFKKFVKKLYKVEKTH